MIRTFSSKLHSYIYTIYQGDIFIGYDKEIISTVLGSCIAICLYDVRRRVGGMSHALLPYRNKNKDLGDNYYCDQSVKNMVNQFLEEGSSLKNLRAKIFGGADIRESDRVGKRNIDASIMALNSFDIEVIARDIGGKYSRKLFYKSDENRVFIKYRGFND